MFREADSFNQPIGNWDVSRVTHAGAMFWGNPTFNQFIGGWDLSQATEFTEYRDVGRCQGVDEPQNFCAFEDTNMICPTDQCDQCCPGGDFCCGKTWTRICPLRVCPLTENTIFDAV